MITHLHLQNFLRHEDTELRFDPDQQLVVVAGDNGVGKCLPGHVRVHDAETGEALPIERFVAEQRKTMLGYVDGQVTAVDVTDWHELGDKPMVEITLADGTTLTCAETHPVLTDTGCVRASDLEPGTWVGQARTLPAAEGALQQLAPDEAWLVGLLAGDGSLTGGVMQLSASDPEVVARAAEIVGQHFPTLTLNSSARSISWRVTSSLDAEGRSVARRQLASHLAARGVDLASYSSVAATHLARGTSGFRYETLCELEADHGLDLFEFKCRLYGGRVFTEWIRDLGLHGRTSDDKHAPAWLFGQPDDVVAAFLGGWFQADGWFSGGMAVGSNSLQLIDDGRLLFRRLSTQTTKTTGGTQPRLNVNRADARSVAPILPLVGAKARQRDAFLAGLPDNATRNYDVVPPSLLSDLPSRSPAGRRRGGWTNNGSGMSRDIVADFSPDHRTLDDEVLWTKVVAVSPAGTAPCYDVTVDSDEHLYVAEATIVHNSSLFDAVLFALYSEAPKGRKIGDLVRRGAELEGCQVEMTFTIGDTEYAVHRRRDGVKTSAILHVDGAPVVEGASAVTDELTRVLGMDAAGFRVAFVAEQGELDGLASMRPADRAKMLTRLLRLDAIKAAQLRAREQLRDERRIVQALGTGLDLDELSQALEQATGARDTYAAQLEAARGEVARIDEQLADSGDLERRHQAARREQDRAEVRLEAARDRLEAAEQRTLEVVVPDPIAMGEQSADELAAQLRDLEAQVVRAESAAKLVESRQLAAREVQRAETRLAELDAEADRLAEHDLQVASAALDEAAVRRAEVADQLDEVRSALSVAVTRREMASGRLSRIDELGATCSQCGQDVDDEHRDRELAEAQQLHDDADAQAGRLTADQDRLASELADAGRQLEQAQAARQTAVAAAGRLDAIARERGDVVVRMETNQRAVKRLPESCDDPESLAERKGELAVAHAAAVAAEKAVAAREDALQRHEAATQALQEATQAVESAEEAVAAAAPSQELVAAHEALRDARAARDGEMAVVTALTGEHATAAEAVRGAERDLERAHRTLDRRRTHQVKAQTAENAARLLSEVGEILTTQIRPALQGAVSDLLARLSEGRFTEALISDTYDVSVVDDGDVVDLASLSGGEQDLVALAVRLALAEVVTNRQGAAGIGTIVLDEVFGSQDRARQASIIAALRGLRDVYGQILLISHVGGLDEHADAVVTVSTTPDRSVTEVRVT